MLYPLVKTFLGKKCYFSHRKTLVNNIVFVAKGIKPSYLVDNVSLTGQSLHAFVQAAIQLDHLFEDLVTVTIEECELFVVNRKALLNSLEENIVLVDISKARDKAVILDSSQSCAILHKIRELLIASVCNHRRSVCESGLKLTAQELGDINRITLYGVMLGFHTVYWCDDMTSLDSFAPDAALTVTSVHYVEGSHKYPIYSFSYPCYLHCHVKGSLKEWFSRIQTGSDFSDRISFEQNLVSNVSGQYVL